MNMKSKPDLSFCAASSFCSSAMDDKKEFRTLLICMYGYI